MHFLGIEIGPGGTRAVALDLESAVIRAEAWVPHDWIEGLPAGYREQNPAQWTVDQHLAVGLVLKAGADAQERGLAAAGWADENHEFAVLDLKVDALEHFGRTEILGDVLQR